MLDGTVHIVTGGGGGLGAATAEELAQHGATVVVNDLNLDLGERSAKNTVDEIVEEGGNAEVHYGDVTDLEYADRLVTDTVREHGRLDGVVNYAGVLHDNYLTKMSGEEWDQVINVHLRGHFALLRAAGRHWQERFEANDESSSRAADIETGRSETSGDRSFLAVSSPSAMGNVGQANYAAAKAGVLGLVRTAAMELHRFGVRVNALIPVAHTRMTESFLDGDSYPPEKVAPVAAYLLSDEADVVTGCSVRAAGDGVALLSDPEVERIAFDRGGWTVDSLADHFEATLGDGVDLDRSDTSSGNW